MADVIVAVLAVVLLALTVAVVRRQGSPGRLSEEDHGDGARPRTVVDRPAGPDAEPMLANPSRVRPHADHTRQTPPEVPVAEQTPIPDDERPVVDVEPVGPGDEPVPDDERPVPDSGADAVPGVAPLPDDERPVPDDEDVDIR